VQRFNQLLSIFFSLSLSLCIYLKINIFFRSTVISGFETVTISQQTYFKKTKKIRKMNQNKKEKERNKLNKRGG